ncbi:hypothetical protein RSOLAG22IIIB_05448 [Rhizoctonia solani]|uniref:Uncharacterized protein n=1 Tax=Rhizoctonia solani TaxID=456999 RepID=A0A0K6G6A4_9AGAM|nr:unnamed protein product [Rhizoctonia solani]CUA74157.1 hypothetical protein RSOLAG22IIIB_05448 [Rhizoctonia solani]
MTFATSLDTWLIASVWLASNSFGLNMSNLGVSSYWTIPLGYVMTLFHHAYLFRDLRRDPSLPIRRVYKFLFPGLILLWLAGGVASILSAVFFYEVPQIRNGVMGRDMVGIAQTIAGGMAFIEAGLLIVLWGKCIKFKFTSSFRPVGSTDGFDKARDKA